MQITDKVQFKSNILMSKCWFYA